MMIVILALLIGLVAGLRAFVAPAAVSWAAHFGWLPLEPTALAFIGYSWTTWVLTVLVLVEFVTDQLPATPSRTVPLQFGARIVTAAFSGAAIGAAGRLVIAGAIFGIVGAVIGTLGGHAARARLARVFGKDAPAAVFEDAVAIMLAIIIVAAIR
jgi:uncharacterized membrane protein